MKVRVTVLGSGTGVPTSRRAPPGFVIRAPASEGGTVLLDPGPGSLSRMVALGTPIEAVDRVVLTHHHPDHTLDFMALLFARRNAALQSGLGGLVLIGPEGTEELYRNMGILYGEWVKDLNERLEIVEVTEGPLPASAGLAGAAYTTEHLPGSLGYRFEFEDGIVAFSGDSGFCDALIRLGAGADLYFLECAMPDGPPAPKGHLTAQSAAQVAAQSRPGRLVLHHFYPQVDPDEAYRTVKKQFEGDVIIAEDGADYSL